MSFLEKIQEGYDSLWKSYVRPPRDEYKIEDLGPKRFYYVGRKYHRKDFTIPNKTGFHIAVSLFSPVLWVAQRLPCIIYLHGNSSSRVEGLSCLDVAVPNNCMLCVFDSVGTGMSEGEYISLGYREHEDLALVINHLIEKEKAGPIGLWGRSMGSVTSLYYAYHAANAFKGIYHPVSALVLDSPFASLKSLSEELADIHTKVPRFIVGAALQIIRSKILSITPLDIFSVNPVDLVAYIKDIPAFFITAKEDVTVPPTQTQAVYDKYGPTQKELNTVDGNHNSARPDELYEKIKKFLFKLLDCKDLVEPYEWGNFRGAEYEQFGVASCIEDDNNIFMSAAELERRRTEERTLTESAKRKNSSHGLGNTIKVESALQSEEVKNSSMNIKEIIQNHKAAKVGDSEGIKENLIELGRELANTTIDENTTKIEADTLTKINDNESVAVPPAPPEEGK